MYKTSLCTNFEKGYCKYANSCLFAHGPSELRRVTKTNDPRKYKTRICFKIAVKEACPHGEKCFYAHSEKELRDIQRPCNAFHLEGQCKFGIDCRFDHQELNKEDWERHFKISWPGKGHAKKPEPLPEPEPELDATPVYRPPVGSRDWAKQKGMSNRASKPPAPKREQQFIRGTFMENERGNLVPYKPQPVKINYARNFTIF